LSQSKVFRALLAYVVSPRLAHDSTRTPQGAALDAHHVGGGEGHSQYSRTMAGETLSTRAASLMFCVR
jgi:hypothetical protein